MNTLINALLVAALALVMALANLLDGPTEIEAIRDVQAEVNALTGGGK